MRVVAVRARAPYDWGPMKDLDLKSPVTDADHMLGPVDAPVTLVEYGDYECPDCMRSFPIVDRLMREFDGRLRLVYRHFPQSSIHASASKAAEAVEAAAAQGRFWPYHNLMYARHEPLGDVDFSRLAVKVELELYRFNADLHSGRFARRVADDHASGLASGVGGTPAFFLNGRRQRDRSYDALHAEIQRLLEGA